MEHLLTFIGFGEAAFCIAKGLLQEGMTEMVAYDIMQDKEPAASMIRKRAKEANVLLAESMEAACQGAKFVLSLTSASVCVKVAESILPHLVDGQVYVDMNSASPTAMTEIDQLTRPEGVKFCDAAMMGSVPNGGHRTKMFLSGNGAQEFFDALKPYNTLMTVLHAVAGGASAIKMFKSVFSKGVPQLLIECLVPAARYGVLDYVMEGIDNPFSKGVEESTKLLLYRTMFHAQRRSGEMKDVSGTIEALGIDASMSRAAQHKLEWLSTKNYNENLPPEEDIILDALIDRLLKDM